MAHEDDVILIRRWFHRLAQHMQAVDYIGARPLFAEDVIAFGSFASFLVGREALEREQWRKVWGATGGFRCRLDEMHVIVSENRLKQALGCPLRLRP